MKRGDHDLTDEHDPPRERRRRPPAHDGTDRDPRTGDAADHRVGRLAAGSFEVAGDQRGERGEDERGTDAFENRPSEREDRHRLRRRGQRRAAGVDDQTDHERPSAADDVADLRAGEDEHRHHQAVERDDGLDRGDRGVEVLDQLTDRDVHHRLVEHHEELRRGQRHECRAALLRRRVHSPTRPTEGGPARAVTADRAAAPAPGARPGSGRTHGPGPRRTLRTRPPPRCVSAQDRTAAPRRACSDRTTASTRRANASSSLACRVTSSVTPVTSFDAVNMSSPLGVVLDRHRAKSCRRRHRPRSPCWLLLRSWWTQSDSVARPPSRRRRGRRVA